MLAAVLIAVIFMQASFCSKARALQRAYARKLRCAIIAEKIVSAYNFRQKERFDHLEVMV
ncbi:hypothetical protein SE17_18385 [Kouleothrix aurantiaca]|uniref:Uncharacterized protein n=1 Tax=Kouleothrix aurantiaca TaxID=186479 RepID=A0A0P9CZG5_9CHLR|nr:hypothetical protein SE17_18385 [Kouleothrix aurantiaca]